jgi:hypothetical protein
MAEQQADELIQQIGAATRQRVFHARLFGLE